MWAKGGELTYTPFPVIPNRLAPDQFSPSAASLKAALLFAYAVVQELRVIPDGTMFRLTFEVDLSN